MSFKIFLENTFQFFNTMVLHIFPRIQAKLSLFYDFLIVLWVILLKFHFLFLLCVWYTCIYSYIHLYPQTVANLCINYKSMSLVFLVFMCTQLCEISGYFISFLWILIYVLNFAKLIMLATNSSIMVNKETTVILSLFTELEENFSIFYH